MIHRYVLRDQQKTLSEEGLYAVIRSPLVTEKSTLQQSKGCYFFLVSEWANKIFIKRAVEALFEVKVASVTTLRLKGKRCQFRGRPGVHSDRKKAMVTLKEGYSLDSTNGGSV